MPPRDRLTSKEKIVAILVWEGHTNREIATRINTSEQVVKNHLRSTFDKLGVWSWLELALYVAATAARAGRGPGPLSRSKRRSSLPWGREWNSTGAWGGEPPGGDRRAARSPPCSRNGFRYRGCWNG